MPYRMPAEWEPHKATWIAWPHFESDFPGKIDTVRWAYCEFIRYVARYERVNLLCASELMAEDARNRLGRQSISGDIALHVTPYNRSWMRDSGPVAVQDTDTREISWTKFTFTGWGALGDFEIDQDLPDTFARISGRKLISPPHPWNNVVLEGGMLDVSGDGLVLVTEECLLSSHQERNNGFTKKDYEQLFATSLGCTDTVWLPIGVAGDDTHGHIDNVARFVAPRRVVVAAATPNDKDQYQRTQQNVDALTAFRTTKGESLEVIKLPMPDARFCDGDRMACGYANFYLANNLVLVPTFNDPQDKNALGIIQELFPERQAVGIHCGDWILGGGTLHCSTQQEPA